MNFKEYVESRLLDNKAIALWGRLLELIADCNNHLAQVTTQMPTYDIHDVNHSERVQENIFELIVLKKEKLSIYELILLYASSYFHDSGMALPEWEHELLKATEGTEKVYDNTVPVAQKDGSLRNDLKSSMSLATIKKYIENNKKALYGDFQELKDFIFAPKSESKLQENLAVWVREYQEFRNRYAVELRENLDDQAAFIELSNEIRCDFIRSTHHRRGKEYILSMQKLFSPILGERESFQFVSDLAEVCRVHYEEFNQVLSLGNSSLSALGDANLSFVGTLLRLGDILHYDERRAPGSLRVEKRIASSSSLSHWNSKNSVDYEIVNSCDGVSIRFSAFCRNPDSYYGLQSHLDAIDVELRNYGILKSNVLLRPDSSHYDLLLDSKVDRKNIAWDSDVFRPGLNAAFTMNQDSIMSLLAGTKLYADKYLCIRELYQNSLDACKCMMAENGLRGCKELFRIEFGLEKNKKGEQCLYCLDNGTGMDDYIINNYFLRIGDSYYTSKDFIGNNTEWGNCVHPTSQFGIGALSCFMVGSRIEVITKHFADEAKAISFTIDNTKNRFYYTPVDSLDKERIGRHGTLLRIVLDDAIKEELDVELPDNLEKMVYWSSHSRYGEISPIVEQFERSLFYKVNSQIALLHDGICVSVRTEDNVAHSIIPHDECFKPGTGWATRQFLEEDCGIRFWGIASTDVMQNALRYGPNTEIIKLQCEHKGIELISFLNASKHELDCYDESVFYLNSFLWLSRRSCVYVDGISVSDSNMHDLLYSVFGDAIMSNACCEINFKGGIRPRLTADRNNIVDYSDELKQALLELANQIPKMIVDKLVSYFESHNLDFESELAELVIRQVLDAFRDFSGEIMKELTRASFGKLDLVHLQSTEAEGHSLKRVINEPHLSIEGYDSRGLDDISEEVLFGKIFGAREIKVKDADVSLVSNCFLPPTAVNMPGGKRFLHSHEWIVLADSWEGKFAEYDVVTQLWPLVPERLFQKVSSRHFNDAGPIDRVRIVDGMRNGIWGVSRLSSVLISRRYNITAFQGVGLREENRRIGEPGELLKSFFFGELHYLDRRKSEDDEICRYALYVFVTPDSLTESQEAELKEYVGNDDYAEGVKKGWSVLILEGAQYYFEPGIQKKASLIERAKKDLAQSEVVYLDLEGNKLS